MSRHKSILFFYTVGIDDFKTIFEAPNAFFQTLFSIYSIRKLWGDRDEIRIYSNYPDKFKKVIDNFYHYKNVMYTKPDIKFTYSGEYGKEYGHARIFILPQLVDEVNDDRLIVYLDPDTGLRKTADEYMREKLLNTSRVLLYRPEIYNDFAFWFSEGKLTDIWSDFKDHYKLPNDAFVINNGIIIVPDSKVAKEQIKELKNIYLDLYDKLRKILLTHSENMSEIFFTDMWACTIAYYGFHWDTLYPASYWNVKNIHGLIYGDVPEVPLIHYYNIKNESPDNLSYWKVVREKMKVQFKNIQF